MSSTAPIGIDLGTTYTCAAIVVDGEPRVIRSRLGYTTIPSVVTFNEQAVPLVGQPAYSRMTLHPKDTVYGSKRLLGRSYASGVREIYQPHFRYPLVRGEDGLVAAAICNRQLSMDQAAALILGEIKRAAEGALERPVEQAVITVPAYYNENQRGLVRKAGAAAGLEVIRILSEPTAAALCYGRRGDKDERLLIFDLGGGTFDVTVLEVKNHVFSVLAVAGDTFLGGLDFDQRLMDWLDEQIRAEQRQLEAFDPVAVERMREAVVEAKHLLSFEKKAVIDLPMFEISPQLTIDFGQLVTRQQLESLTADLVERAMTVVSETLKQLSLSPRQIDQVLLVGGQTRMPLIRQRLKAIFGKDPGQGVHPDEVVALGAAVAAALHDSTVDTRLRDVVSVPIGIANADGSFSPVIARWSPLPVEQSVTLTIPRKRKSFSVAVFQGPHPRAADNAFLGTMDLAFNKTKEDTRCQLRFCVDEDGILSIHAKLAGQSVEQQVDLVTRQTPDEVLAAAGKERLEFTLDQSAARSTVGARKAKKAGFFHDSWAVVNAPSCGYRRGPAHVRWPRGNRVRMTIVGLIGLVALTPTACHKLFPFGNISADAVAARDAAGADQDGADLAADALAAIDLAGTDLSLVADAWASFGDDFEDGVLGALWTSRVPKETTLSEEGGTLLLRPAAAYPSDLSVYVQSRDFDMRGASCQVQLVSAQQLKGVYTWFGVAQSGSDDKIQFLQEGNILKLQAATTKGLSSPIELVYDTTLHRYLRLRQQGGDCLWETADAPPNWVGRGSLPCPIPLQRVKVLLGVGTYQPIASPAATLFDNFLVSR